MGVSFKLSKIGTRFRSMPLLKPEASNDGVSDNSKSSSSRVSSKKEFTTPESQRFLVEKVENIATNSSISSGPPSVAEGREASFTLNLFPEGYSIGKPLEIETANNSTNQDLKKLLHPYDRLSESLFLAIESGHLPGDILEDIPCKYIDGALICEVHDYRRCSSRKGSGISSTDGSPIVNRVRLKMSLENVVKDIPFISDNSWTYGDLMEVESRILKALQPQLLLDPTPQIDRLCDSPVAKLNLIRSFPKKRPRQMPEITVTSSNKIHGKKVCIDRVPESPTGRSSDSGTFASNATVQQTCENLATQNFSPSNAMAVRPKSFVPDASISGLSRTSHQSKYPMGVGTPRSLQEQGSVSAVNALGASPLAKDVMIPYADNANANASLNGNRENQEGLMSPLSNSAKRMRLASSGLNTIQQQQLGSHVDGCQVLDMNWQNTLLQQQAKSRGIQYQSTGIQTFSQQAFEGGVNQDTGAGQFASGQQYMRFAVKKEQFEMEKIDGSEINQNKTEVLMEVEKNHLGPQQLRQQRLPQHVFMRSNSPLTTWNNLGQQMEKEAGKEDQLQKRKSVQSPCLSTGALALSPLSSKSGEFLNGSVGPNFGPVPSTVALGASQKEKAKMESVFAAAGTPLAPSPNDSTHRQHQAQLAAKRRSNSLPKIPVTSGIGSPASVSNVGVPLHANSPSVGSPAFVDQALLDRLSKIKMVTMRHQLNCKKNKVDDYPMRKQNSYSPQHLAVYLSNASDIEGLKDDNKSLSKSLVGGSMNVCKIRDLQFMLPERVVQGNVVSFIPRLRNRMIMSEKQTDGTVAIHYGEIDVSDFLAAEEHLPTLPNTHFADLLAEQSCSLMAREGYIMEDDHLQPKPNGVIFPSENHSGGAGVPPNNAVVEMHQYGEFIPGQSSNEVAKADCGSRASVNSSQNLVTNARMLPPGNPQTLQMSEGHLSGVSMAPRPQQLDPQKSVQQQQQLQQNQHTLIQKQDPWFQKSPMMLGTKSLSQLNAVGQNSNMQVNNHMVNKLSPLQIQLLQRQQQQQRETMMGLGTAVGSGNMRNNIVGLGGLSSPTGIGAARGIGGSGISAPMASISGMGNMGQKPMNLSQASSISNVISQQLRSGTITPAQAELLLSKIRMSQNRASMIGASQSSIAGISAPGSASLSMLGQSLNKANISTLQRAIGPMGSPNLMAGVNLHVNQQQQHQEQLQLQQQQQQQQQQLLQPQLEQKLRYQQETTTPLQAVASPLLVGSPSTLGIQPLRQQLQLQQTSPQLISQGTPMSPQQLSSGAVHTGSAGNPETCPASPQLSSQTLGC